jgi:hypothetical protein
MHWFTALLGLFVIGSWLFWLAALVLTALMFFCIEDERNVGALLMFVVTLFFLNHMARLQVFGLIAKHPFMYVGGYILCGILYGFIRWGWHVFSFKQRYNEAKRDFAARYDLANDFDAKFPNDRLKSEQWESFRYDRRVQYLPTASQERGRIVSWMMYWPWNLVWTLLRDFVLELWERVYEFLSSSFQRWADSILGKEIRKDFGN